MIDSHLHCPDWPIVIKNISLRIHERAILVDVNLELQPQGRTVILGHNGSGKTSLLHILHGLCLPTTGQVLWGGKTTPSRARQAYVPARALPFRRSVIQNILLALRLSKHQQKNHRRIAEEAMEICQISSLAHQPARLLSSGETQKLFLARAWALGATTLFLDEPTANLDPASIASIEHLINELCAKGVQIVLVTHDIAQAQRLADKVVFLHQGRVAQYDHAESFFTAPQPHARAFLSGQLI